MTPEQEIELIRIRARARMRVQQEDSARSNAEPQSPAEPHRAQRQEAARYAAERMQRRAMMAPASAGLSFVTEPIVRTLTDPDRRAALMQSAQGAWRDLQQVPSLDLGRLAQDTGRSIQQGVTNLPQTIGGALTHLPDIAAEITYRPFQREEEAQQRLDMARIMGDSQAAQRAAMEANTATAQAGLNVAAPLLGGGSALRTGSAAMALDAPFALSRNGDRPLQERLPGALTEIAGTGAFASGAQELANALPALARPSRAQEMVARMDRAGASVDASGAPQTPRGVTPSLATANRGAGVSAPTTNLVADNIFAGGPTRARLRQSATELRDAVHDVRDAYGPARGREGAGRVIQQGLERYADDAAAPNPALHMDPAKVSTRDWSFAAQSREVFDHVLRPIGNNPAQLQRTMTALNDVAQRADSPIVRSFQSDPTLNSFASTARRLTRGGNATLRDLRELRRKVREAQGRIRIGPDSVDNAALQRIEAALTEDIYAAAGPTADQLRAADRFYRRGMERINGVRNFFNPDNPSQSIQQILRAASPRTENAAVLAELRTALRDPEWRIVAASIIDEMGAPLPGAKGFVAEQGFSIERFATAYRNMTPRARRILFGSRGGQRGQSSRTMRQLADDLDNLAQVADAQKAVQAGANSSGSATHLQNIASIGGVINPATFTGTVMGIVGGVLTGEMLTNPAFVRWLVSARRNGTPQGMRRALSQLQGLAARDPALYPAVAALESQLQDQRSGRAPQSGGDPVRTPLQREPALQ